MGFLYYILGLLTIPIFVWIFSKKKNKFLRRGILTEKISSTSRDNVVTSFEAQYELGETERTDSLSKVSVINVISDISEYNSPVYIKRLTDLRNGKWTKSNEISWIEKSSSDLRNDKIEKILK